MGRVGKGQLHPSKEASLCLLLSCAEEKERGRREGGLLLIPNRRSFTPPFISSCLLKETCSASPFVCPSRRDRADLFPSFDTP